jgi:hypothetical protein
MVGSMISVQELVRLLGVFEDAPALQEALSRFGGRISPLRDDTQLSFISFRNYGLSFAYEDEATLLQKDQPIGGKSLLITVHLYSEGFENFHQYQEPLPAELSFHDSREQVRGKLGKPSATKEGKRALGRQWPSWDRYDLDAYSLLAQYPADFSKVDLVSLIAPVKARAIEQSSQAGLG